MAQLSVQQNNRTSVYLGEGLVNSSKWWSQIDGASIVSRYKHFLELPDLAPYLVKERCFYVGSWFRFDDKMRHKYFVLINQTQSDEVLKAKYIAIVDEIESFYQDYLVKSSWVQGAWVERKENDTAEGRNLFFQKLFDALLSEAEHEHQMPVDIESLAHRLQEVRLSIQRVNASKKQKATLFLNHAFDRLYTLWERLKKSGYGSGSICDREDSHLQKAVANDRSSLVALPGMVGKWKNLSNLGLFSLSLTTLPVSFAKSFPRLERLNMSHGLFTNPVISVVAQLVGLKYLELENNPYITEVPAEIGQLVNLKGLKLGNTSIQTLPVEIEKLTHLEYLSLEMRPQRAEPFQLPEAVGKLTSLKKLNLEGLSLTTLPVSMADLSKLERMNLSYNRLQALPSWIQNWQKLKSLTLCGNETLESLPQEITALQSLTNFIMAGKVNVYFFEKEDEKAWIKGVGHRFQEASQIEFLQEWDKNTW
jgi:hypothetical protein